ncbi:MAG: response regulator [Chloroflexota bacterium]
MLTEIRPPQSKTRTVLVVDDQPMTLALTARMLRSLGYTVITTDVPMSALALAQGGDQIDCVLTDLTMPDMSGVDLAQQLREVAPSLPVVFMSGYPEDISESLGAARGAIHLDKPFTMAALHTAVSRAIG